MKRARRKPQAITKSSVSGGGKCLQIFCVGLENFSLTLGQEERGVFECGVFRLGAIGDPRVAVRLEKVRAFVRDELKTERVGVRGERFSYVPLQASHPYRFMLPDVSTTKTR